MNESSQFTFYCSIFDQYSVFHVDVIPLGFELAKDFGVANVAGRAAADYVSVLLLVIIVWSNNIITITITIFAILSTIIIIIRAHHLSALLLWATITVERQT